MKSTVSLGFKVRDYEKMQPCPIASKSEADEVPTKIAYPSMTIPGNKALARALKPGQTITATVEFKVSEVTLRERDGDTEDGTVEMYGGTHVELEAQSMTFDGISVPEDGASEETDGASAFKKFMSNKAKTRNSDDSGDDGAK